jgi:hypothetical protein
VPHQLCCLHVCVSQGMCVRGYVCLCVRVRVCVHVCVRTGIRMCVCVYVSMHKFSSLEICSPVRLHILCARIRVCVCVCVCVCVWCHFASKSGAILAVHAHCPNPSSLAQGLQYIPQMIREHPKTGPSQKGSLATSASELLEKF